MIGAESPQYNAVITRRRDLTDGLTFLRVRSDDGPRPFVAGQYLTVGLVADGRLVQRPYSVASSARRLDDGYELYIRLVPGGRLTPHLFRARPGQRIALRGPKGRFVLDPADDRPLLFVATGCGIAPFMAMLRTLRDDGIERRIVLVHGVSHARELAYRAILETWSGTAPRLLRYVPTVSRPRDPANVGWRGSHGRAEAILARVLRAERLRFAEQRVYVCGNPEMTRTVRAILGERGFGPEQVHTEDYWPLAH